MAETKSLTGLQILIVEDEYMIATDLARSLEIQGATVIGPVGSLTGALELAAASESLDAAVLDINLGEEKIFTVADLLVERGVPFVFATGYEAAIIPEVHSNVPRFEKPIDTEALARHLSR